MTEHPAGCFCRPCVAYRKAYQEALAANDPLALKLSRGTMRGLSPSGTLHIVRGERTMCGKNPHGYTLTINGLVTCASCKASRKRERRKAQRRWK